MRATLRLAALGAVLVLAAAALAAGPGALEGTVVRVVGGDTGHVRLGDRVERVRYIGVNTPEVHHPTKGEEPGGRAAALVNRRLGPGKRGRVGPDAQARGPHGGALPHPW